LAVHGFDKPGLLCIYSWLRKTPVEAGMGDSSDLLSQKIAPQGRSQVAWNRDAVEHKVKCWPRFFDPILSGEKTHDLRRAGDRDYRVGDFLLLQEFDPQANRYTGRELIVKITYITSADNPCAFFADALNPDFCILSIQKL
jgi:Domain of unknown function (DUF3850)